jgi:hypothetical protein
VLEQLGCMKRFFDRLLQRNAAEPEPKAARPSDAARTGSHAVKRELPRVNTYQAVEIVPCLKACDSAREI